ncbi:hypothetical protein D3C73_1664030 [compost metagenome]
MNRDRLASSASGEKLGFRLPTRATIWKPLSFSIFRVMGSGVRGFITASSKGSSKTKPGVFL